MEYVYVWNDTLKTGVNQNGAFEKLQILLKLVGSDEYYASFFIVFFNASEKIAITLCNRHERLTSIIIVTSSTYICKMIFFVVFLLRLLSTSWVDVAEVSLYRVRQPILSPPPLSPTTNQTLLEKFINFTSFWKQCVASLSLIFPPVRMLQFNGSGACNLIVFARWKICRIRFSTQCHITIIIIWIQVPTDWVPVTWNPITYSQPMGKMTLGWNWDTVEKVSSSFLKWRCSGNFLRWFLTTCTGFTSTYKAHADWSSNMFRKAG